MTMQVLAVNVELECSDGSIHQGATLAFDGVRRVYLASDGSEIANVDAIKKCRVIVPPMIFAAALYRCKEVEHG